jgi:anthranilate synthase/aminodeoxychorismate synthase-like glutamine amidotransferase
MLLIIDNYDSFDHNLARHFERLGQQTLVVRNDAIGVAAIRQLKPRAIVLSPGPCAPKEAGVSLDLVRQLHAELPILGVCLGHQTIAAALGGVIHRANRPMHGRTSLVQHHQGRLFAGLSTPLLVCRYHSLVIDPATLPSSLQACAWTENGTIMAIEHTQLPLFGVQFHPEAILTEQGYPLLQNFLQLAGCDLAADSHRSSGSFCMGSSCMESSYMGACKLDASSLGTSEIRQTQQANYRPPSMPVTF